MPAGLTFDRARKNSFVKLWIIRVKWGLSVDSKPASAIRDLLRAVGSKEQGAGRGTFEELGGRQPHFGGNFRVVVIYLVGIGAY